MADEKEFENLTRAAGIKCSRVKDPYQKICGLLGIAFSVKDSVATMRNAIIASNAANPNRDFAEILKKLFVDTSAAQSAAASTDPAPVTTQDTGKFRTNTLDQFYTSVVVAKFCIKQIVSSLPAGVIAGDYLWIEPSAGNGAFFLNAPSGISPLGIDIDPKAPGIVKHDFLTWTPPVGDKKILVFGNPPFGRQSTLAKAFIAHSCKFANIIAFILPKSFVKSSMSNAFSSMFHCAQSIELAKNAFILNDSPYDVPCVFQIWQKKDIARAVVSKVAACGFQYMKAEDDMKYDIALRRVGGLAGKCYAPSDGPFSVQSHYFLKFDSTNQLDELMKKINDHTFPSNTVGPRSLSKSEINVVLNGFISAIGVAAAPSVAPSPVEI